MTSDGTPWRPLVHVADIASAVGLRARGRRARRSHNEIFNVGDDSQNYRISEIAGIVAGLLPSCPVRFGRARRRQPQLSHQFRENTQASAGFPLRLERRAGRRSSSVQVFRHIGLTPEIFKQPAFTRLEQLKRLMSGGQVDRELYSASARRHR